MSAKDVLLILGALMGAARAALIAWWLPLAIVAVLILGAQVIDWISDWRINRVAREIERNQRRRRAA